MPTYQYTCTACGEPLEAVQSFQDDALTTCPACGKETLRKVFNSVGVVFKGSGFYRNDSRNQSSSHTGSTEKSSDSAGKSAKPAKEAAASSSSESKSSNSSSTSGGGSGTKVSA